LDLYQYQLNEIDSAKLRAGEEEEIETKLPSLKHAEKLKIYGEELCDHLYNAEGSLRERLQKSRKLVESVASLTNPTRATYVK
jgi:DNA repair ATPase RecN